MKEKTNKHWHTYAAYTQPPIPNQSRVALTSAKINTESTRSVFCLHCALGYCHEGYFFLPVNASTHSTPTTLFCDTAAFFPFTQRSREFNVSLKYGSHMINVGHVTSMRNSCHSGPMLLERFLYILCLDLWPGVVVERFDGWKWKKKQYMGDVFEFLVSRRGHYVVIWSFGVVGWSTVPPHQRERQTTSVTLFRCRLDDRLARMENPLDGLDVLSRAASMIETTEKKGKRFTKIIDFFESNGSAMLHFVVSHHAVALGSIVRGSSVACEIFGQDRWFLIA